MRVLIQRVTQASVTVDAQIVGQTGPGLLILACAMRGDDDATATALAGRVARLRIFRDDQGRMNRSVLDTGGTALVVSQFTLAADTRSGNRPASPPPPRPTMAGACTNASLSRCATWGSPPKPGALARTCRWLWSMTGR